METKKMIEYKGLFIDIKDECDLISYHIYNIREDKEMEIMMNMFYLDAESAIKAAKSYIDDIFKK